MNKESPRRDISTVLATRGITLHRLARQSDANSRSLWKFMHIENANLNTDSLFKLWPCLYGEQTPQPILDAPSAPAAHRQ